MPTRTSEARWSGNLLEGKGSIKLGSGAFDGPFDWRSRSADGAGTNPEELLGAAHAGCFSMALSAVLTEAGHAPASIHTTAKVHLDKVEGGFVISRIELATEASVPSLTDEQFLQYAAGAKSGCPVSKALAGTEISLVAKLVLL